MLVGRIVNKLPVQQLRQHDDSLVDSDTLLGVEVEVENCPKTSNTKDPEGLYWAAKEDHSLRNNGMEFVFAEPLFGADVVRALHYICNKATNNKWAISERTGIHVHVDVRNMELEKFQNMCILYALTEHLIYEWIGDRRDRNIHCLPWYAADADLERICMLFNSEQPLALEAVRNLNRYAGLNLNSLASFGTAEFRQLKTTFDVKRILTWINILLSLKKAAVAWQGSSADLLKEVRLLGAHAFCSRIFGPLLEELWTPDFAKTCFTIGTPTALFLLENSKKFDSEKAAKLINAHIKNSYDEHGTHPGIMRFKKKRSDVKKEGEDKEDVISTSMPESQYINLFMNAPKAKTNKKVLNSVKTPPANWLGLPLTNSLATQQAIQTGGTLNTSVNLQEDY